MAILKNVTIDDTGAFQFPAGTTAQRPGSPATGDLRFNTNINDPEFYTGLVWTPLVPTGAVEFFARNSPPDGWLRCNGASLNTTTFAALFAVIGYNFGGGGANFNVPDLRGEFLRGLDDSRGVDGGRAITTFQDQDWKGYYMTNTGSNTFAYSHGPVYMGKSIFGTHTGNLFGGRWQNPAASQKNAWDDSQIRPRNVALLACIKY